MGARSIDARSEATTMIDDNIARIDSAARQREIEASERRLAEQFSGEPPDPCDRRAWEAYLDRIWPPEPKTWEIPKPEPAKPEPLQADEERARSDRGLSDMLSKLQREVAQLRNELQLGGLPRWVATKGDDIHRTFVDLQWRDGKFVVK
jgi:hypothetical protein